MSVELVKNETKVNFKQTVNDPQLKFSSRQKKRFFHEAFPSAHLVEKDTWFCPKFNIAMHLSNGVTFK